MKINLPISKYIYIYICKFISAIDVTGTWCKFLPNEQYCMLHKVYQFLALNAVLSYILVFVYYSFYEITYYMYIFKMGKIAKEEEDLSTAVITNY